MFELFGGTDDFVCVKPDSFDFVLTLQCSIL